MKIWLWEQRFDWVNASTPGPQGVGEVIQLPVQDKSGLKDDLFTAGIFWDESFYGRGKVMTS